MRTKAYFKPPEYSVSKSEAFKTVRTHAGNTLIALRGAVDGDYQLLDAYEPHNLQHIERGAFDHLLPFRGKKLAAFKKRALSVASGIKRLKEPLIKEAESGFKTHASVNELTRIRLVRLLEEQASIENTLMRWFRQPSALNTLRRALNAF